MSTEPRVYVEVSEEDGKKKKTVCYWCRKCEEKGPLVEFGITATKNFGKRSRSLRAQKTSGRQQQRFMIEGRCGKCNFRIKQLAATLLLGQLTIRKQKDV